jgi:hypothetical protein
VTELSPFKASFNAAFDSYNRQFQPIALEKNSPEYDTLTSQAEQLRDVYDMMANGGLHPQILINHTESAPTRQSRRNSDPHDPLVTDPKLYNRPYVTFFGAPRPFKPYQDLTDVLREAIINEGFMLVPEATSDNLIASSTEIELILKRRPIPTERVAFVGRDTREVRSGIFGHHHVTYPAKIDYFPTQEATDTTLRRGAHYNRGFADVYTDHHVIPAFGILHLTGAFDPSAR